jgi:hypothetical protein
METKTENLGKNKTFHAFVSQLQRRGQKICQRCLKRKHLRTNEVNEREDAFSIKVNKVDFGISPARQRPSGEDFLMSDGLRFSFHD